MKAIVFHGVGDIRFDDAPDPRIQDPTDAIVRITASSICGTDLHVVRGSTNGYTPGTILGHEGVGIVVDVGRDVRNFQPGDRVVIPSTIACGTCVYCRQGYTSQCDNANPQGKLAGTAYYGGPESSGPFPGLQAEFARVPFANFNLVRIPEPVTDSQAITLSDIFPTGYFGAILAEIRPDDIVAVFGCGPVGLFAIAGAKLLGAGRVIAVDTIPSRLEAARKLEAEIVDFKAENPVETIRRLTDGIGVDRAIDAVGLDAVAPSKEAREYEEEVKKGRSRGPHFHPGNAPSVVLYWGVESLAKAGTFSIVGLYDEDSECFPIGRAFEKNLTINIGVAHHRRLIPKLLRLIESGVIDPAAIVTQHVPLEDAVEAYRSFDARQPGWIKVELDVTQKVGTLRGHENGPGTRRRIPQEGRRARLVRSAVQERGRRSVRHSVGGSQTQPSSHRVARSKGNARTKRARRGMRSGR
jgi:threonine dehydrogenase-like Zn-dependent dehydrogenase